MKTDELVGKRFGTEVVIEVVGNVGSEIRAKVVHVDNFWATRPGGSFKEGMVLTLYKPGPSWIVREPSWLPWFLLDLKRGTFEHHC